MTIWTLNVRETSGPRYMAIADAIEQDIASGALAAGAQLPTQRDLAGQLGVTVGTVTRGYAEAERRGLIMGEVGRGTYVLGAEAPADFGWREAGQTVGDGVIDMSLACPWVPPDGSDGRELSRTLVEIARDRPVDELLWYDPQTGSRTHRTVAANWLAKLGHEVPPDRVVVTSGAQHAIAAILASIMGRGDVLAAAELTYPGLVAVTRMLGIRTRGIRMDEEGIVPEALDVACESGRITALYCVPTVQNPTGVTMSAERRAALAEVARRHGLIVLEDEIHVSFPQEQLPPIATFAPERTLFIATLSKWVAFGLRVGFVAAPERAVERLRAAVRSSVWQTPPLMVELATRWITDGTAERMGERKLVELDARHAIVREVFADQFVVQTQARALHLWVHLPDPLRSDECVAQARQRGVLIAGAEAFAVGRDVPHAVRISIAQVPHREDVRRGLEILREIFSGCSDPYAQIL